MRRRGWNWPLIAGLAVGVLFWAAVAGILVWIIS